MTLIRTMTDIRRRLLCNPPRDELARTADQIRLVGAAGEGNWTNPADGAPVLPTREEQGPERNDGSGEVGRGCFHLSQARTPR